MRIASAGTSAVVARSPYRLDDHRLGRAVFPHSAREPLRHMPEPVQEPSARIIERVQHLAGLGVDLAPGFASAADQPLAHALASVTEVRNLPRSLA